MSICNSCYNLVCGIASDEVQQCERFIPVNVGLSIEERVEKLEQELFFTSTKLDTFNKVNLKELANSVIKLNEIKNKQEEKIRCLEKKFEEIWVIEEEKIHEEVMNFLIQIKRMCKYWADLPNKTPLEMCEGVAFSILNEIDGGGNSENLYLSVENNLVQETLHELFCTLKK